MIAARTLLAAAVLGLALPASLPAQDDTDPPMLQAGDRLRIEVWRQPELSGSFEITGAGTVAHPLYRELHVAGRPLPWVEAEVGRFLERYEATPRYVVEMLFRVSVGGEVRSPGLLELTPQTTVSQAIARAGGVTQTGRLDRVVLTRGTEQIRLDLTDPQARHGEQRIRSGDQIVVLRRVNVFRDYIAPAGSIMSAIVSLTALLIRL